MRSIGTLATVVAAATLCLATSCGSGGGGGGAGSGNPALVNLITSTMPTGTTGVWYEVPLDADFPNPPGLYLLVGGALPPGISLDRVTGLISGFPRQVGVFTFSIAARDGQDPDLPPGRDANFAEDRQQFTLQIFRGPPHILPQVLPAAQYRAAFSYFIDIAGGTAPYSWALTAGSLPVGITLNPSTGELCCLPTAVNPVAGNPPFSFQVTATDSAPVALQDTANLELQVVVLPLTIATPSPAPPGAMDFPYDTVLLLASAGAGAPYTWSQKFPLGAGEVDLSTLNMTVSADGHLRNIGPPGPNTTGTFFFTAEVSDESNQKASRQYSISFNVGPVITSISPTKSSSPGPFTVTGLNFQPGANIIFKPGGTQNSPASVNVVDGTTITFPTAPPPPGGVGGFVTVRVRNPDGGFADLPNSFAFPAASLSFNTNPSFPATQSQLSSTGVDVGDVDKDGFADIVHSGTNSTRWGNGSGTNGGVDLLINAPPGGVFSAASPAFNKIQLNVGGDWHGVKFHDVDTDGWLDVVATGNIGGSRIVRTWINSAGTFAPGTFTSTVLPYQGGAAPISLTHVTDMAMGKIDGDLAPDLLYAYQDGNDISSTYIITYTYYSWGYYAVTGIAGGSVQSLRGLGNGAFSNTNLASSGRTIIDINSVGGIGLGRIDSDTRADAVVGDAAVAAATWQYGANAGDTTQVGSFSLTSPTDTFGSWTPLKHPAGGVAGGAVVGVAVGDINGDLRDDVVLAEETSFAGDPGFTTGIGGTPSLVSYSGSGLGTLSELPILKPASRLRFPALIDGDFDAAMDIVVTGGTGTGSQNPGVWNRIEVYKGRPGTLGPQARQTITLSSGTPNLGRIASGDISGDGRPDIVAALSCYVDDYWTSWNIYNYGTNAYMAANWANKSNGTPLGVVIYLNTSL